eukprot:jgi/Bigna1/67055/fgenesh1_pg.2_\
MILREDKICSPKISWDEKSVEASGAVSASSSSLSIHFLKRHEEIRDAVCIVNNNNSGKNHAVEQEERKVDNGNASRAGVCNSSVDHEEIYAGATRTAATARSSYRSHDDDDDQQPSLCSVEPPPTSTGGDGGSTIYLPTPNRKKATPQETRKMSLFLDCAEFAMLRMQQERNKLDDDEAAMMPKPQTLQMLAWINSTCVHFASQALLVNDSDAELTDKKGSSIVPIEVFSVHLDKNGNPEFTPARVGEDPVETFQKNILELNEFKAAQQVRDDPEQLASKRAAQMAALTHQHARSLLTTHYPFHYLIDIFVSQITFFLRHHKNQSDVIIKQTTFQIESFISVMVQMMYWVHRRFRPQNFLQENNRRISSINSTKQLYEIQEKRRNIEETVIPTLSTAVTEILDSKLSLIILRWHKAKYLKIDQHLNQKLKNIEKELIAKQEIDEEDLKLCRSLSKKNNNNNNNKRKNKVARNKRRNDAENNYEHDNNYTNKFSRRKSAAAATNNPALSRTGGCLSEEEGQKDDNDDDDELVAAIEKEDDQDRGDNRLEKYQDGKEGEENDDENYEQEEQESPKIQRLKEAAQVNKQTQIIIDIASIKEQEEEEILVAGEISRYLHSEKNGDRDAAYRALTCAIGLMLQTVKEIKNNPSERIDVSRRIADLVSKGKMTTSSSRTVAATGIDVTTSSSRTVAATGIDVAAHSSLDHPSSCLTTQMEEETDRRRRKQTKKNKKKNKMMMMMMAQKKKEKEIKINRSRRIETAEEPATEDNLINTQTAIAATATDNDDEEEDEEEEEERKEKKEAKAESASLFHTESKAFHMDFNDGEATAATVVPPSSSPPPTTITTALSTTTAAAPTPNNTNNTTATGTTTSTNISAVNSTTFDNNVGTAAVTAPSSSKSPIIVSLTPVEAWEELSKRLDSIIQSIRRFFLANTIQGKLDHLCDACMGIPMILKREQASADDLLGTLILCIIQAKPAHLMGEAAFIEKMASVLFPESALDHRGYSVTTFVCAVDYLKDVSNHDINALLGNVSKYMGFECKGC